MQASSTAVPTFGVEELIEDLRRPSAYPNEVEDVEVVQTHISVVYLAGDDVFKVKKPVELGFLDYSSRADRLELCLEEVRLNRRLAPGVYHGVVPITLDAEGRARFGGSGEAIEHAVHMRRLPDERRLSSLVRAGAVDDEQLRAVGAWLARFHLNACRGPAVARLGGWVTVRGNCMENFEQLEPMVAGLFHRSVFDAVANLTRAELAMQRALIESRASRGVPCEGHGDLRLEHLYWLLPDAEHDRERLVAIDCIEFNERFRFADPIADLAFVVMDLRFAGRWDLSDALIEGYVDESGDAQGRALLPLYTAYRATVRAKVKAIQSRAPELPQGKRERAREEAPARLLLALGELALPAARPCLVPVGGLPGVGKTTLARALEASHGFVRIQADAVRKQLAGIDDPHESASTDFEAGIYAPEWSARTYAECLHRARGELAHGRRVVVDASFVRDQDRRAFLDAALSMGVRFRFLALDLSAAEARRRLEARQESVSDADWRVYQAMRDRWEPPSEDMTRHVERIDGGGSAPEVCSNAAAHLRRAGLAS